MVQNLSALHNNTSFITSSSPPAWHAQPLDVALCVLSASASIGLNHAKAARRLAQCDRNSLPIQKRRGPGGGAGKHRASDLLLGSLTQHLLREAECDVLVVPPALEPRA